jgi:hypothetical protein
MSYAQQQISLKSAATLKSFQYLRFVKADHFSSRPFVPPEDSFRYSLPEIVIDHLVS